MTGSQALDGQSGIVDTNIDDMHIINIGCSGIVDTNTDDMQLNPPY